MKSLVVVFLAILTLHFSSCSPVVYSTNAANVPLFQNKNEIAISAGLATTDDGQGVGLQTGVALDSSWAAIASYYSLKEQNTDDDWKGNGRYVEFGIGTFGKLVKKGSFFYEAYVGFGSGKIENTSGASYMNVKYIKPFLQPSFGFFNQIVDVAFTPRVAFVSFTDYSFELNDALYNSNAQLFFNKRKNTLVFEPCFTVRVGYRNVKLQLQYGTSTFSYDEDSDANVNTQSVLFGAHFLLGRKFN